MKIKKTKKVEKTFALFLPWQIKIKTLIMAAFCCFLFTMGVNAQTASPTCSGSTVLTSGSYTSLTQYDGEGWFSFVAPSNSTTFNLTNSPNDSITNIYKIELFGGSCGSLTLLGVDSLSSVADSILNLTVNNLDPEGKYYIRLTRYQPAKNEFSLEIVSGPIYCGFYYSFDSPGEGQIHGSGTADFPDFIAGCVVNNTNGNPPGNPIMHTCELTTCRPQIYIGHAWASPGLGSWVEQHNTIYVFTNVSNTTYSFAITNYTAIVNFNVPGATQYTIVNVGSACLPPEITPQLTPEDLACNCSTQLIVNTVLPPNCSLNPNPLCTGNPICFINPNPSYPVWGFGAVFPQTGPSIQLDNNDCVPGGLPAGNYQIGYWAYTLLPNGLDDPACFCNKTFDFTVYEKPSVPLITASPEVVCSGNLVTLSATSTGATLYSWTPGNYSGQTVVAGPVSGNTTYMVTATNSAGCSNTSQITIIPMECCINPSRRNITLNNITLVPFNTPNVMTWNTFTSGNYSNQTVALPNAAGNLSGPFSIIGMLTVNAAVNFNNTNIYFSEAASVNQLMPMTVQNSYWHGCTALWQGIISKNQLTITGSIIEDAANAVLNFLGNPHPGMDITNTIFNINYNGITLAGTNFATLANAPKFKLAGNIFTCRNLPAFVYSTYTQPGNIWVNTVAPNLSSYFINTIKGSAVLGITGGIRSLTGVNFSGVNNQQNVKIGESSNAQNQNAVLTNYFDFLNYGVKVANSKTFIQNAVFQNMTGGGDISGIWHQRGTTLIGETPNGNQPYNKYLVQFRNSNIGVYGKTGGTLTGKKNTFTNIRRGVNIENYSSPNSAVSFIENHFVNCQLDLYSFANSANLTLNFLANTANGPYPGGRRHHVFINELSKATSAVYNINNNTLTGKDIGIFMQNAQNATIRDNTITNNLVGNNPSLTYNCIELNNVDNSRITENILSSNFSGASSAVNVTGINSAICVNNVYACNTIYNTGACLKYNGPCPSHIWKNQLNANPSNPSKYGIWVNNSGSTGNIGFPYVTGTWPNVQIAWGRADNEFGDFNYGNAGFDTYASNNSNSPNAATIFWNGSPNTAANPSNPFLNGVQGFPDPSLSYNKVASSVPFPLPCGQFLFNVISNLQSDNQRIPPFFGNSLNFGNNTAPTLFNARRGIYELLKTQALNTATLQGAAAFLAANQSSSLGEFYKMDSLVASNDSIKIATAKSQNSSFVSSIVTEQTQKDYNAVYFNYASTGTVTSQEISTLVSLAQLCPFTDGNAVYQARALLSRFDSTEYSNLCEYDAVPVNSRYAETKTTGAFTGNESLNTNVFPNPATTQLFINTELENGSIMIYNVLGEVVVVEKLTQNTIINIEVLSPGTYLYKVLDEKGQIIKADKIVIAK